MRHLALAAIAVVALAGCAGLTDVLSPGKPAEQAPARLAMSFVLPRFQDAPVNPNGLFVTVLTDYERADESFVALDSTSFSIANVTTQQVPVTIELGPCLSDPQRRGATSDPDACFVKIDIALRRIDGLLDRVAFTPIRLAPGETSTFPGTVQLFEVSTVTIGRAPGNAPLPALDTLVQGTTVTLQATAFDALGAAVLGRSAAWSSSNTAVLDVSTAGVVTAVAPGQARVTGTVGGRSASADFVVIPPPQRLTVAAVPSTGTGRVTSTPAGIDCTVAAGTATGTCQFDFPFGTSVDLTTSFVSGSALFSGWTGACVTAGTAPTCTLAMTEPRTAGLSFTRLTPVTVSGTSDGVTITSDPTPGILCTLGASTPGACFAVFPVGTTVRLSALEFSLARVRQWIGCDTSTRLTCDLIIGAAARDVIVDIDPPRLIVTFTQGDGEGVITSPPAPGRLTGLSCGAPPTPSTGTCSAPYAIGSTVLVSATPADGSRFAGWVGGPCSGTTANPCSVLLDGAVVVQFGARFEIDLLPVTLDLFGAGGGRIFVNGSQACELGGSASSVRCVLNRPRGDTLTFTGASLGIGQFVGFYGDCGPGTTCTRIVSAPLTISAEFTDEPAPAIVTVRPRTGQPGTGFVLSSDEAIACSIAGSSSSGSCSITRAVGDEITLNASDYTIEGEVVDVFMRWGPGSPCAGSGELECTFTLTSTNTDVTVEFGPGTRLDMFADAAYFSSGPDPLLSVTVSASGYRTLAPCVVTSLSSGGSQCSWAVPRGQPITLRARSAPDLVIDASDFPICSLAGTPTNASCTFTLSGPESAFIFAGASYEFAMSSGLTYELVQAHDGDTDHRFVAGPRRDLAAGSLRRRAALE
jgi:hypothetical protein